MAVQAFGFEWLGCSGGAPRAGPAGDGSDGNKKARVHHARGQRTLKGESALT
jgi:hypothetical protein